MAQAQGGLTQLQASSAPDPSDPNNVGDTFDNEKAVPPTPALVATKKEDFGASDYAAERAKIYRQQQELMQLLEEKAKPNANAGWSALARGFANPNAKWFYQGLAGGAENLKQQQEDQDSKAIQLAQMRLQVANQGLAGMKEQVGMDMANKLMNPPPPTSAKPEQPATSGAGQPTDNLRNITGKDIFALSQFAPDMAKKLESAIKLDTDRFKIAQNGTVFDTRTGTYVDLKIPGQNQSPVDTRYGQFNMTPYDFSKFQEADRLGKGKEYLQSLFGENPESILDRKIKEQLLTTQVTEREKERQGRIGSIITAGSQADSTLMSTSIIKNLAESNPDAFGIISKPGILNAIAGLVSEGIKAGSVNIGIPSIEEAIRKGNPNATQDTINAAIMASQQMAQLELKYAQTYLKGQGSVSNNEREIVSRTIPNLRDPAKVIVIKSELMQERAKFDKTISNSLYDFERNPENKNKNIDDFVRSKEYLDNVNKYDKEVGEIIDRNFKKPAPITTPSSAPNTASPAKPPLLPNGQRRKLHPEGLAKEIDRIIGR